MSFVVVERPAAQALNAINGQNACRMAMMLEERELARMSKPRELFEVIGRYGDRAMEFVWKHKVHWPSPRLWQPSSLIPSHFSTV